MLLKVKNRAGYTWFAGNLSSCCSGFFWIDREIACCLHPLLHLDVSILILVQRIDQLAHLDLVLDLVLDAVADDVRYTKPMSVWCVYEGVVEVVMSAVMSVPLL